MTPTKEQIDEAARHCRILNDCTGCPFENEEIPGCIESFIDAYRTKCAEVEELRGLINEILPVGDIADGLAPYYIEADTIHRMRKALEGKE